MLRGVAIARRAGRSSDGGAARLAFARMTWIPGNDVMTTYDVTALLELALLAPALIYDKLRYGRVHRAYWIGLALTLPWLIGAP
jgi:hypothetical protein